MNDRPLSILRLAGLVLAMVVALLLASAGAGVQGPQPQAKPQAEADPLLKEILSIVQSGGEEALRAWMKTNSRRVGTDWITRLAERGSQERDESRVKVALVLAVGKGDTSCLAKVSSLAGDYYSGRSENAIALELFERALRLYSDLGDRLGEARTLNNIGTVYDNVSEPRKALEFLERARLIFHALGDHSGEGGALTNIGGAYSDLGEPQKALEFYEQALPLVRGAGDRAKEAAVLINTGRIYWMVGDLHKALEYYQQALPIYRALGHRVGEATTLNNIGLVQANLGNPAEALEHYGQALALFQAEGRRAGEAMTLNNMGVVYSNIGDRAKALEYYKKALPIRREIGDRRGEAMALGNIGVLYADLGESRRALESYNQALQIFQAIGDRFSEAKALINIGALYAGLGEPGKAAEHYLQALPIERTSGDRPREAATLTNLMLLYRRLDRPRLAIFFGKQAINLYQELRASLQELEKDLRQSISFGEDISLTYRELADILAGQGRLGEAQQVLALLKEEEYFEFVRRDAAVAKHLQGRADLTPAERDALGRYGQVADQMMVVARRVEELEARRDRSAQQEAELAGLKADLTAAAKSFQVVLRQIEDDLGGVGVRGAADVVQELRATRGLGVDLEALGGDIVVLSTVISEKAVWVILTTPTTQSAGRTEIAEAELNRKILAFREALLDPATDPRPMGRELYDILLKPVEKDMAGAAPRIVAWVLDGALRYMPPAALFDGKRYLVERFASVELTLASRSRIALRPRAAWRALGFGMTEAVEDFKALPGVADELRAVVRDEDEKGETAGVLPGRRLLDRNFTRRALEASRRGGFPVIHIASHFAFRPGNAADSFLLLGDASHLTLDDLRSQAEPLFAGVELLTLSACETALGAEGADGREVEGLGVEAQNQGAQAVLATLWSVEDSSTAELMAGFYRRRQEKGLSKAEALRQAQLALLKGRPKRASPAAPSAARFSSDPKHPCAHPFFWAPFILMGNWR